MGDGEAMSLDPMVSDSEAPRAARPAEGRELELKLDIEPDDTDALLDHPLLRDSVGEPRKTHSIYYDTKKKALQRAGVSLRVRRAGDRYVQTVKANGKASAGLFDRSEWEEPIAGPAPDLDRVRALSTVLDQEAVRSGLQPVFETRIERRACLLEWQGARIEVVIDRGSVVAGKRNQPVLEVELELIDGPPQALFALARALQSAVPLRLGVLTKAERGARLSQRATSRAVKAEKLTLSPTMSVAEAFQAIAFACLRHFRSNEPLVMGARDVDALHQARVALRRLRSALSLFKPVLAEAAAHRFRDELRDLSNKLGEARNLDVLLQRRSEALGPEARRRLVDERTRAYDAVMAALRTPQVRTMMLDLVEWIALAEFIADDPSGRARAQAPLPDFATAVLRRFWKKVRRSGRQFADLDDEARHELRIAGKKLRYAAEFFAALYDKRAERRDQFITQLQELQEELGDLNDLATERELEERLAALAIHLPAPANSDGGKQKATLLARSDAAYRELAGIGAFWR
ncbi:MAG: hypothetical protein JWN69_413 [Alphaproteobacteria bacterium]|nr:hypothetical protein [Alphaproteobacteria bacterium]